MDTSKVVRILGKGPKDFSPGRSGYFIISATRDLKDRVQKGEISLCDSPNHENPLAYIMGHNLGIPGTDFLRGQESGAWESRLVKP
jgi:hypothetical protein